MLVQISGWIGTLLILAAYFLNSYKYLESQSRVYQAMNLFGAIGVGINVVHQEAWPAVALQVVWGAIAFFSLARKNR